MVIVTTTLVFKSVYSQVFSKPNNIHRLPDLHHPLKSAALATLNNHDKKIIQLKEDRNKLIGSVEKKDERITHLTHEIQQLRESLEDQQTATPQNKKPDPEHLLSQYEKVLSEQLSSEMLVVQSQLALAQQELEKKFNQTAAYMNMKKMISSKNDQVRELQKRLIKYEPQETVDSD